MEMNRCVPVRIGLVAVCALIVVIFLTGVGESSITVEQEGYSGLPGDEIEITVSVTNDGPANDTAILTVNDTNGWEIQVPGQFDVDSGQSMNRTIIVTIPDDARSTEQDQIRITVDFQDSGDNDTEDAYIDVQQVFDLDAKLFSTELHAAPGRNVSIFLMLTNGGNGPDYVNITMFAPKKSQGDFFKIHEEHFIRPVDAFDVSTLKIVAPLSPMALPGVTFGTIFYANSSGGQSYELVANITIDEYDTWIRGVNATEERNARVVSTSISVSARFGTLFAGQDPDAFIATLTLSIHGPVAEGTPLITETTMNATKGNFTAESLTMTLDYEDPVYYGEYVIRATVTNGIALWYLEEINITLVEPEFEFVLRCLDPDRRFTPNDDPYVFDVVIENTGNARDTYVVEVLSDDVGFTTVLQGVEVGTKDEVHINVTFTPSIQLGVFSAEVRVLADSTHELKTLSITATVAEDDDATNDGFPYLIVIIAAAVVGTLLFFFKTEIGWLYLLSVVPLYYRVTGKKVLDNYVRGKIHGYVIANPGDHYNGIKGRLGINNGTLSYHLKVLERESLVKSRMDGKYKRFYPYESMIPSKKKLTSTQKLIVDKLRFNPEISQRKLAKLVGESVQVVNYHMKNLEVAGVVEIEKLGNRSKCSVSEKWR